MKYLGVNSDGIVMLKPETVDETGLCQWLARRFDGKAVTLEFDTTGRDGIPHAPTLWVKPPALSDMTEARKDPG